MSDAEIRDHLNLYFVTGDPTSEQQKATDALFGVLDHIGQCECFADELEGDDLRNIIARKLGVSE